LTNPLSISIGEWDFFDFENSCIGCEECMFWLEKVVLLIEWGKSFKKFETLFIKSESRSDKVESAHKKKRAAPKGSDPDGDMSANI